jgi:hypothetical protein
MVGRDPHEAHRVATPLELRHTHHIVERHTLFVLIALGEGIVGAAAALSAAVDRQGWDLDAALVGIAGTGLTFGMWWLYDLVPSAARPAGRLLGGGVPLCYPLHDSGAEGQYGLEAGDPQNRSSRRERSHLLQQPAGGGGPGEPVGQGPARRHGVERDEEGAGVRVRRGRSVERA